MTSVSAARMAAMASMLPVRVVPMPLWPGGASALAWMARAARSALMPYTAQGTPPPTGLPSTRASGFKPNAWV